jgi:hypothetical protein
VGAVRALPGVSRRNRATAQQRQTWARDIQSHRASKGGAAMAGKTDEEVRQEVQQRLQEIELFRQESTAVWTGILRPQ